MVQEKEFQAIVEYIQNKINDIPNLTHFTSASKVIDEVVNVFKGGIEYEDWKAQHKPKRTKRQPAVGEYAAMFEELWSRWPATGNFTHEGKKYVSDRVLRSNKQVCLGLYTKAITEGHKWGDINHAAKVEVAIKKQESAKKGVNQLQYLSSLEVWLRQQRWIAWEGVEIPQETQKPVEGGMVSI